MTIASEKIVNMSTGPSKEFVMRHVNAFIANDLKAVLSDYTEESVLITKDKTYRGLKEIEMFFAGLIVHFPKQTSSFQLDTIEAFNDIVYIVWQAKTLTVHVPLGSDTFIIKSGKIFQQTFIGQLNFLHQ
jgi:hypothetical protein